MGCSSLKYWSLQTTFDISSKECNKTYVHRRKFDRLYWFSKENVVEYFINLYLICHGLSHGIQMQVHDKKMICRTQPRISNPKPNFKMQPRHVCLSLATRTFQISLIIDFIVIVSQFYFPGLFSLFLIRKWWGQLKYLEKFEFSRVIFEKFKILYILLKKFLWILCINMQNCSNSKELRHKSLKNLQTILNLVQEPLN